MPSRYQGRCPDCHQLVWCCTAPRLLLEPVEPRRGQGPLAVRINVRGEMLARAVNNPHQPIHSYEFRARVHECAKLTEQADQPLAVVLPFDLNRRRNRRKR